MSASHVSGRHAHIDVSLDGILVTRTESDAARRGTDRSLQLAWEDVHGASVQLTRSGRHIVRISVAGAVPTEDHREDPYAVKVLRRDSDSADQMVIRINAEVEGRRRWRENAGDQAG